MQTEAWIKLKDKMPNLHQEIEVKSYGGITEKTALVIGPYGDGDTLFFKSRECEYTLTVSEIEYWRPILERKPDFSKLKENDLILFTYSGLKEEETVGFLHSMKESIKIAREKSSDCPTLVTYDPSAIKKIIRINPETKKFEEI